MNIENINKGMPFVEDEYYVADIVSQVTENAINKPHAPRWHIQCAHIAASIAITCTIGCSGWLYMKHQQAKAAPLDTFLSSITDKEAAMLDYYYVEDSFIEEY